jgi:ATP-dependent Clp protease, protease subunit
MLSGEMDPAKVGHVIVQLMTMDADGDGGIDLYIDATGDDVGAALSLMDVIDMLGVEVTGTVMGRAEGVAVGVLAVCALRRIAPNARVMLREPHFDVHATARDLQAWSSHTRGQLDALVTRLAEATGQLETTVRADLERGLYLDAASAVAYGLADSVASQLRVVAGKSDS